MVIGIMRSGMKIIAHLTEPIAGFHDLAIADGHTWTWWDNEPAFDIFDRVDPDLVILDSGKLDTSTFKRMGEYKDGIPTIRVTQLPSEILFHVDTHFLTIEFQGIRVPAIVDTNTFVEGSVIEELKCDLAMIGPPNKNVKQLLYPIGKYNVKLFGPQRWTGVVQYMGNIGLEEQRNIYRSAALCYADTPQEDVRIVACGGCVISMEESVGDALGEFFIAKDIEHLSTLMESPNEALQGSLFCQAQSLLLHRQPQYVQCRFPLLQKQNLLQQLPTPFFLFVVP